jgi:hypothetical protein
VTGKFDGRPVSIPVPREPRTGDGEFCAFVIMAHGDSAIINEIDRTIEEFSRATQSRRAYSA